MSLNIVILAAGQGKRMNSALPKVLHKISNKPMLQHVIETAKQLNPSKLVIVYGHGGDQVQTSINNIFANNDFIWAFQDKQLGTGHALKCALQYLDKTAKTLVLYGDVPLIALATLQSMLALYNDNLVMLSDIMPNPTGYGRVERDKEGRICAIVEQKDASSTQLQIKEVNTGFYVLDNKTLAISLANLSNSNAQGEYYLTDLVAMAYLAKVEIKSIAAPHAYEVMGVNNKLQLEELERINQLNLANDLLLRGATLLDKSRIDIRGNVNVGQDCIIDVNCIFEGNVTLGNNVVLGAGCVLKNTTIGDNVVVQPYSVFEDAEVGTGSKVGPFARLRPGSQLLGNNNVGNFVEIKKSVIGLGSKVNHLTYIGDAELGEKVNVGAGSVTCNYDGTNKHKTSIGDNVFIGSGTMMVAPVTINSGALIGAGSVITKDAPQDELTVARAKQTTITGWLKKNKK